MSKPEDPNLISREEIRALMEEILQTQGKTLPSDDKTDLRTLGFRSLDFSELAIRVEDEIGHELNFDAPGLRSIETIADVLELLGTIANA